MSVQNQPKTIEDYKDVVKILKLKIIKQAKKLQEMELKVRNYEEQINNISITGADWQVTSRVAQIDNQASLKKDQRQSEMNSFKGKVDVMNTFVRNIKKIGISPQSIFRIADFSYKTYVESQFFRQVLAKMKLGLSQKQISCLIFIFDEACSGFITREDFLNCLNAYKVGVQNSNHIYIQQCIFKLSQILYNDHVNLMQFYEQMQAKFKPKNAQNGKQIIDLNIFGEQIKKLYATKLNDKQIIGSFNAIDMESEGYLQKNNFLYCITSYINKLLASDQSIDKKSKTEWNPNLKSHVTDQFNDHGKTSKASPKKTEYNSSSKLVAKPNQSLTPNFGVAAKLQSEFNTSLYSIFEQVILFDFSHRLTLKNFKKIVSEAYPRLPTAVIADLYKQIDHRFTGSIYFNQIINFCLSNSQDSQIILRILGKYFHINDLSADKFWYIYGFNAESQISKAKFTQILGKAFQTKEDKAWQKFWSLFDKGKGTCNVGSIIKAMQKYEIE